MKNIKYGANKQNRMR